MSRTPRVDVYCSQCEHRGKAPAPVGALTILVGNCTRCGGVRLPGKPPSDRPVGRPRLNPSQLLRRQAGELEELADEIDAETRRKQKS